MRYRVVFCDYIEKLKLASTLVMLTAVFVSVVPDAYRFDTDDNAWPGTLPVANQKARLQGSDLWLDPLTGAIIESDSEPVLDDLEADQSAGNNHEPTNPGPHHALIGREFTFNLPPIVNEKTQYPRLSPRINRVAPSLPRSRPSG